MLGIIIICGASVFVENCTVSRATIVFQAPQVFIEAETCQLETMAFAEASGVARQGDVTRIICAYPPTFGDLNGSLNGNHSLKGAKRKERAQEEKAAD